MQFKKESRSQLYYGQYRYGLRAFVREANLLKWHDHAKIDSIIAIRNRQYLKEYIYSWRISRSVQSETAQHIHEICDILMQTHADYKKICNFDHLMVYTNDMDLLSQLTSHPGVLHWWGGKAEIDRPQGVLMRCNPKWHLRSYFREQLLDRDQSRKLNEFVSIRADRYRLNPSLRSQITQDKHDQWPKVYIRPYYFIDHVDESDKLLLSLTMPGLIKKTLPIQAK